MTVEIYYFTGTGNSLHVANELHKKLPTSKIIPIAALLENDEIEITGKSIGLIFPCHGLTIPIVIREFLNKMRIGNAEYFFAITTRGGTVFRGFPLIDKALKKQGKSLNSSFVLDMWMNDPKLKWFELPTEDDLKKIEKDLEKKVDLIQKTVIDKRNYHDDPSGDTFKRFRRTLERLIPFMVHHVASNVKKYFYSDDKCTGCGICEKVCPSQKIKMENNKPIWQVDIGCYTCYACLNFCSTEAVQIYSKFYMKSYTPEKGRYPHPYAKVKDMVYQKNIPENVK